MNKKFVCILMTAAILTSQPHTYAARKNGAWADEAIDLAISKGIIPDDNRTSDYTLPIRRIEIAELAVKTWESINGSEYEPDTGHFEDTDSVYAASAFELGIMEGTGYKTFSPGEYTTREEMAKIILLMQAACTGEELELLNPGKTHLTDFEEVSEWAKPFVYRAIYDGIVTGYEDDTFRSLRFVSYEEAIALVTRAADFGEISNPDETGKLAILTPDKINPGEVTIKWNGLADSRDYTVKVTENRLSYHEGHIPPNGTKVYTVNNSEEITLTLNPHKRYTVEVISGKSYASKDIITSKITNEDAAEIKANYPQSQEEAEPLVTKVTVPVWKLKDGKKISSSAEITVHNKIADKIKLVFEEIFSGEEKFPINYIGGYAWRGGKSEHNGGTAIDINYMQNYCVYKDGSTVGDYWKPGEDPYSINPYGDVVRAFEKYGFTWGGDSWANTKDYMHFSYLGT